MEDDKWRENAEHLLKLVAIYHRTLCELERREADYGALEVPLELRNYIVGVREDIYNTETQLQQLETEDTSGEVERMVKKERLRWLAGEVDHLHKLQNVRSRKIRDLEKRKAMHAGEAPMALINTLASEQEELEELGRRLRHAEVELAELRQVPVVQEPPKKLHIFVADPDGTRYETEVSSDVMVAELKSEFLAHWRTGEDTELIRYKLRLESQSYHMEPALTLAESGVLDGAVLYLEKERLYPDSPVGLTIEGPDAGLYVTAVRLGTRVAQLARAFMDSQGSSGKANVELLTGARQYRLLRGDATLYDERVGDGAQLRIIPAA